MEALATDIGPPASLEDAFFEENLALLDLAAPTLELVRAAASHAKVELLGDSTPVLRIGEHVLGLPFDDVTLAPCAEGVTVVFGLGLGQAVRSLRDGAEGSLVVYEPDPSVLRAVLEYGPTDLGGVEVVCTLHDLGQIWPRLARGRANAILVRTPGYTDTFPAEYRALIDAIQQLVHRTKMNRTTHQVRAQEWVRYTLENLEVLTAAPCFQGLAGAYKNVPAFIVGAGPSLGKNGALLAEAAKKGIVIAVNTSARALAKYGVEPQIVACIESIDVSHLLGDLPFFDRVVRAFSLAAHPNTLKTGGGPLLPIYEGLPQTSIPLEQLTGQPGLAVCGSVSTIAFSLAQRLGASPIVFVGQDLAYTGGKAYARGTAYEESSVSLSKDGTQIDFNWCETLKTTHDAGGTPMHESEPLTEVTAWGGEGTEAAGLTFEFVRAWLEDAALSLARSSPELRLVNATEGGARIHGFEEKTLAEVLEGLPDLGITAESIASVAREKPALSRERIATWATGHARLTREVAKAALRVRRFADRANRAILAGRPRVVSRSFAALDAAERALRLSVTRAPLVDAWACAAIDGFMAGSTPPPSEAGSSADAVRATRREAEVARLIEVSAGEVEAALVAVAERFR